MAFAIALLTVEIFLIGQSTEALDRSDVSEIAALWGEGNRTKNARAKKKLHYFQAPVYTSNDVRGRTISFVRLFVGSTLKALRHAAT
jgi:hypothetical protein